MLYKWLRDRNSYNFYFAHSQHHDILSSTTVHPQSQQLSTLLPDLGRTIFEHETGQHCVVIIFDAPIKNITGDHRYERPQS